ncbi:hypothetical protein ETN89_06765 [Photobacterium damselae subsp. damselae]|uniref:hypothetical protein n=1 Tax=Photobacterium damselae TaxID=38293 RepID=UPI000A2F9BDD|nr:hypothetical protein [Photobacterium damselae]ARR50358.1 hypothetical protein CAY62_13070 [Photobacterium damselae subsp. damselae]QAY35100.1 hypothetical protein ETN89_06765 [Photobacterium damselae subsp. damselae]QOQ68811.1 hypothetical protein IL982_14150 [Photobacterium damselae subsp. damselae]
MDIERFTDHGQSPATAIIMDLPATVEMTGFTSRRYLLSQQPPQARSFSEETPDWATPLER